MAWLKSPHIPVDSNAEDRVIRPLAAGRRNGLFIGSPEAGKRATPLCSLVREYQRAEVGSEAYLTDHGSNYLDGGDGKQELDLLAAGHAKAAWGRGKARASKHNPQASGSGLGNEPAPRGREVSSSSTYLTTRRERGEKVTSSSIPK